MYMGRYGLLVRASANSDQALRVSATLGHLSCFQGEGGVGYKLTASTTLLSAAAASSFIVEEYLCFFSALDGVC